MLLATVETCHIIFNVLHIHSEKDVRMLEPIFFEGRIRHSDEDLTKSRHLHYKIWKPTMRKANP
jgi:hypothetical protein